MKKFAVLMCVIACVIGIAGCAFGDVPLDEEHFPDPIFREYLRKEHDHERILRDEDGNAIFDASGWNVIYVGKEDGILDDDELKEITNLRLVGKITSLKGWRHLTSLVRLDLLCSGSSLTELDLDGCTVLMELRCDHNQLTKLDVSGCTSLEELYCSYNQIKELDLSDCPSIEYLKCDHNDMTYLDLSSLNKPFRKRDDFRIACFIDGLKEWVSRDLKVRKNEYGSYEIDFKYFMPVECLHNVDPNYIGFSTRSLGFVRASYDPDTGIATFVHNPPGSYFHYLYNTNAPGDVEIQMSVSVEFNKLPVENDPINITVEALERSGFGTDNIICDMNDSQYLNTHNNAITEGYVADMSASTYGKEGFTADGNSRLILRLQADTPGTVTFSLSDNIGATLEQLTDRKKSSTSTLEIETTDVGAWGHQASAVLIAPERFPDGREFPSDKFKVHVDFEADNGTISSKDIELKIEAAPVVLVHGLFGSANTLTNTFGVDKNTGIYKALKDNKFNVSFGNYDGLKGPSEVVSGTYNRIFNHLATVLDEYQEKSIVCTKVDVVAFGMGGLVMEKFLSEPNKDYEDGNNWTIRSYKQGMVRRLITIATPHRGTPWADLLLGPKGIEDFFSNLTDNALLNNTMVQVIRNIFPVSFALSDISGMTGLNELTTTASYDYCFPSGVPIFAIYGNVHDDILKDMYAELIAKLVKFKVKPGYKLSVNYRDIVSTVLSNTSLIASLTHKFFKNYGPRLAPIFARGALKVVPVIGWISLGYDIVSLLPRASAAFLFLNEENDLCVSASSAAGNFSSKIKKDGWNYRHFNICKNYDVGVEVVSLLKGASSRFETFGTDFKSAARPATRIANKTLSVNNVNLNSTSGTTEKDFEFTEALKLRVEPSVLEASTKTSQTVKFTVNADNPMSYDIYCVIDDEGNDDCKLFLIPAIDGTGKNFYAEVTFESRDVGTKNIFCFSHNPNAVGTGIYSSNAVRIIELKDMENVNIVKFGFEDSTLYTNVNSETPVGLFAVDSDGRYYDVSSPLNGTQWTSDEIARVNDNGCIFGLSEGTTTLTATFRGLTASVNVEVAAVLVEEEEDTPPEITTEALSNGITNQPYSLQLTSSGTTPITWTLSGKLPAGLTMSESGLISGTPTKTGKSSFTVKASNTYGEVSQKYTLQVFDPVSITTASLKSGTIGKSYSVTMKAKGTKTITWTAEGLPNGLTMNAKGKISGKPTVYGMFNVKVKAENGAGSVTKNLTLEIKAIAPKLSGSLKKATLNETYSSGLKVTGSTPITWSIEGNLPDGLTLDTSTGIISGIPTSYAKSGYKITLTATNDGGSKSKKITLKVNGKTPKITAKLPQATAGENYSAKLSATGSEPITFAADLPEYLTLEGNTISGTVPASVKSFKITVYASNPVKEKMKKNYTVKVSAKKSLPSNLNVDNNTDITEINTGLKSEVVANVPVVSERDVYSHSVGVMIVAELGKISTDKEGMYDFEIKLPDYVRKGSELVYIANSDNPSDDDDIAEFYDETGSEIATVPENRRIIISVWLNPETVYNPVIAVKH